MRLAVRSPKPEPGRMSMVLVPMPLMSAKMRSREPCPSATTETTEAMPMMMPSMVSKVRNLCATMARTAMPKDSCKRPMAAIKGLRCGGIFALFFIAAQAGLSA